MASQRRGEPAADLDGQIAQREPADDVEHHSAATDREVARGQVGAIAELCGRIAHRPLGLLRDALPGNIVEHVADGRGRDLGEPGHVGLCRAGADSGSARAGRSLGTHGFIVACC